MREVQQRYDVNQVRERTDLLSLISQYVALRKRGGRYTGLCPFHQEKTPSFSVDPQKGFWHCFGCGKGGDAFSFLMQIEHLSFPEALEKLGERAGVRPIEDAVAPQRKEERDLLFEVNEAAAQAFATALRGGAGAAARAYLARREISPEQAARFGLGYAPRQWDALVNHLRKRGFAAPVLVKAGLAMERNSGDGLIDRFRNRLMIPIQNRQGRVVAFGGRALAAEDQPKYLNTAETPIFHKSRTLYALHLGIDRIARQGRAIVAEGYFDVIACHLAGFTEAVATLGTALSEDHVQLLRRLAERIYLVYDADSAGINAALRSQALFRAAGAEVRIVRLPEGHDPDTFLREQGPDAFEACLAAALSPVEFELERLMAQHPNRDTDGRVRFFREAAKVLQPLPRLERAEYAAWLIHRWLGDGQGDLAQLQQAILVEVSALDRAPRQREPSPVTATTPPSSDVPLEREVMTGVVQDAELAARAVARVPAEAFTHAEYREIFAALRAQADGGLTPDVRHIAAEEALAARIAALAVREMPPDQRLSFDDMLERLRELHDLRQARPQEIALEDHQTAEELLARHRERSRRAAKRGGFDE